MLIEERGEKKEHKKETDPLLDMCNTGVGVSGMIFLPLLPLLEMSNGVLGPWKKIKGPNLNKNIGTGKEAR